RLAVSGVTLRRRTGGRDAGWTLKLPVGESARQEVSLPLPPRVRSVPAELRALVTASVGGRRLVPVVRIRTHRAVRQLLGAGGRATAQARDGRRCRRTALAAAARRARRPRSWCAPRSARLFAQGPRCHPAAPQRIEDVSSATRPHGDGPPSRRTCLPRGRS